MCNVVLNTITAEAFKDACDRLEGAEDFDSAVMDLICEYVVDHQRIIFSGNGYSKEWAEEAKRRGLPNLPSMVDAIPAMVTDKSVNMFGEFGVFSKTELESRVEIQYEIYAKAINIEARTMIDMATKQIIPAVIRYTTVLADSINSVKSAGAYNSSVQESLLEKTSNLLAQVYDALARLEEVTEKISETPEGEERARFCQSKVTPLMEELRKPVDELEMIVDKEMWPIPSYGDLLFEL
jgi:glutamine synthetase